MKRRCTAAAELIAVGALTLFANTAAQAHETDPRVVTVLEHIRPALPRGVIVQVRAGIAAQLVVANNTRQPLEVLAQTGEVFLRVGRDGVFANFNSPAWYLSNNPFGVLSLPAGARTGATPRFARVSSHANWGWFDHRLHGAVLRITDPVRTSGVPTPLGNWLVPMRYAGRLYRVTGRVEYRPLLGTFVTAIDARSLPSNLTAEVLQGRVPGLALQVASGNVSVLDRSGETFASITPDGAVVNSTSVTYLEDQRLRGKQPARAQTRVRVPGHVFSWLDPRLRYSSNAPPAAALHTKSPSVVADWVIPLRVNGRAESLRGTVTWVPAADAAPTEAAAEPEHRGSTVGTFIALAVVALATGLVLQSAGAPEKVPAH